MYRVEEELPLKQGLKPASMISLKPGSLVEEELPLKQGLKPAYNLHLSNYNIQVEEELPLKQGLKLVSFR